MRVLFYQYGNEDWLSVGALSAILRRAGHETDLLLEPPLDLYLRLPLLRAEDIRRRLLARAAGFKPDLFAVSSTTDAFGHARAMIALVKQALGVPVVLGGVHATALPGYALRESGADALCVGEGDYALLDLVEALAAGRSVSGLPNIWVKTPEGIVENPVRPLIADLDALPFADKELFGRCGALTTQYNIMAGRGCPYGCTYCCNALYQGLYGGKGAYVRRRSVRHVIEELNLARRRHGARSVYFWDDSFTTPRAWLEEFAGAYRAEVGLPFHCLSRPEGIDAGTAALLRRAGCTHVNVGLESGSERVRARILDRHYSNARVIEAVSALKANKIRVNLFTMLGLPGETEAELLETLAMNRAAAPSGSFAFQFKPFPGTRIVEAALREGILTPGEFEEIKAGGGGKIQSPEGAVLPRHPHAALVRNLMVYLPLQGRLPAFVARRIERGITRAPFPGRLAGLLSLLFVDTSRTLQKARALLAVLRHALRNPRRPVPS